MNAATRGVILAVVAVALGAFILGQGFSDSPELVSATGGATTTSTGDGGDGGGDGTTGDDTAADDSGITESPEEAGATDDGGGDDAAATADDGGDDTASADDSSAQSDDAATDDGAAAADGDSEVPDILHPANEVRVLVANGTTVAGAAGRANDSLVSDRGYGGLTPTNTTTPAEASAILYQQGYELDARQIAQILELAPGSVAPMPDAPPVDDLLEAHVLVIIGPDFPTLG